VNYLEKLSWDTDFFKLPIGRINLTRLNEAVAAAALNEAQSLGLRCLYFEADPSDAETVAAAEKYGFHLVDVRVMLEHPFNHAPAPLIALPKLVIDSPRPEDMPRLREMAVQIGYTSRFAFDRHFAPGEAERFYSQWLDSACEGFADAVLVARWQPQGEAVGLLTCTQRDAVAHIQLIGTHLDQRRRGIGAGLVQAGLNWAKTQHVGVMQVVTQARNIPAQRLYQQMGFLTRSMSLYYHKWLV
jgi:dTDP-4-amino-4,6-dideoxy-D-galactose acyltransferase